MQTAFTDYIVLYTIYIKLQK